MRTFPLLSALTVCVLTGQGWSQPSQAPARADGRGDRIRQMPPQANLGGAGTTGNGIDYHGGPVLDTVLGSP
ncbi:MAG TPA: hypothetical protein VFA54_05135, partial [Bryobacterales bacterium]|nr:hypothetical protein [Bryobacterales bacterium]